MPEERFQPYRAYRHSDGVVRIETLTVCWERLVRDHEQVAWIAPTYTGVCSADIKELRGERPGRCDFGHEVVGTVLRSTHPNFRSGECVVLNPFLALTRETAFAERMYVAGPDDRFDSALLKVPSSSWHFALVEPLACVIHAARQSHADARAPRLICGAGFFGYLLYCYLAHHDTPVTLTNRSPERLAALRARVPGVNVSFDIEPAGEAFATVFLMQSRLERADVARAAGVVRESGEVVLFGALDRSHEPQLHAVRNLQQRVPGSFDGKTVLLQGTLDAAFADLQAAATLLARADFMKRIAPIVAEPLTFEHGAPHLTQRVRSPSSPHKHLIAVRR